MDERLDSRANTRQPGAKSASAQPPSSWQQTASVGPRASSAASFGKSGVFLPATPPPPRRADLPQTASPDKAELTLLEQRSRLVTLRLALAEETQRLFPGTEPNTLEIQHTWTRRELTNGQSEFVSHEFDENITAPTQGEILEGALPFQVETNTKTHKQFKVISAAAAEQWLLQRRLVPATSEILALRSQWQTKLQLAVAFFNLHCKFAQGSIYPIPPLESNEDEQYINASELTSVSSDDSSRQTPSNQPIQLTSTEDMLNTQTGERYTELCFDREPLPEHAHGYRTTFGEKCSLENIYGTITKFLIAHSVAFQVITTNTGQTIAQARIRISEQQLIAFYERYRHIETWLLNFVPLRMTREFCRAQFAGHMVTHRPSLEGSDGLLVIQGNLYFFDLFGITTTINGYSGPLVYQVKNQDGRYRLMQAQPLAEFYANLNFTTEFFVMLPPIASVPLADLPNRILLQLTTTGSAPTEQLEILEPEPTSERLRFHAALFKSLSTLISVIKKLEIGELEEVNCATQINEIFSILALTSLETTETTADESDTEDKLVLPFTQTTSINRASLASALTKLAEQLQDHNSFQPFVASLTTLRKSLVLKTNPAQTANQAVRDASYYTRQLQLFAAENNDRPESDTTINSSTEVPPAAQRLDSAPALTGDSDANKQQVLRYLNNLQVVMSALKTRVGTDKSSLSELETQLKEIVEQVKKIQKLNPRTVTVATIVDETLSTAVTKGKIAETNIVTTLCNRFGVTKLNLSDNALTEKNIKDAVKASRTSSSKNSRRAGAGK